jgi:hypothetical protein
MSEKYWIKIINGSPTGHGLQNLVLEKKSHI